MENEFVGIHPPCKSEVRGSFGRAYCATHDVPLVQAGVHVACPKAIPPQASVTDRRYPVLVVCALIVEGDSVLLERRAPANVQGLDWMFDLPGGKVECDELPADAIIREIREELGCEIVVEELIPELKKSVWNYGGEERHWILAAYRCRLAEGQTPKCDPRIGWAPIAGLSEDNTLAADLDFIRKYAR